MNEVLHIMGIHIEKILKLIYEKNRHLIRRNINEERIQNIIQEGKKEFPTLGNNKFVNIPKRYKEDLDNHFTNKTC